MSSSNRVLDLRLTPREATPYEGLEINTIVWSRSGGLGQGHVTLAYRCGPFDLQYRVSPDEARVLANQLLQCADAADEQRAEIEAERRREEDEQRDREMEADLAREAEERGEDYVPAAIGAGHLSAIDAKVRLGIPLKPWEQRLAEPAVQS